MKYSGAFFMFLAFLALHLDLHGANEDGGKIALQWELGISSAKDEQAGHWIPAVVSGAVQLDVATAEDYGPYWWNDNFLDYKWMESKFSTYRTFFPMPEISEGHSLYWKKEPHNVYAICKETCRNNDARRVRRYCGSGMVGPVC